jgi:hypothetical protein
MGLVAPDCYADLKSSRNRLLLHGREWLGRQKAEGEAILLLPDGAVIADGACRGDGVFVVVFTPEAVRFYDMHERRGGYYPRLAPVP